MNKKIRNIILLALVVALAVFTLTACTGDGHAPGYGNTKKCTICGKPATHSTGSYGYCDKHWQDAINYKGK